MLPRNISNNKIAEQNDRVGKENKFPNFDEEISYEYSEWKTVEFVKDLEDLERTNCSDQRKLFFKRQNNMIVILQFRLLKDISIV